MSMKKSTKKRIKRFLNENHLIIAVIDGCPDLFVYSEDDIELADLHYHCKLRKLASLPIVKKQQKQLSDIELDHIFRTIYSNQTVTIDTNIRVDCGCVEPTVEFTCTEYESPKVKDLADTILKEINQEISRKQLVFDLTRPSHMDDKIIF